MPPKTPNELREQLERENEQPAEEDHDRSAEGIDLPRPKRADFFANLGKLAEPDHEPEDDDEPNSTSKG